MKSSVRPGIAFLLAMVGIAAAPSAKADQILSVDMNFQSGATFVGTVTFADGFTGVLGVDGNLTGYQFAANGYQGTGSDPIEFLYDFGANFSDGTPDVYSVFLVDASDNPADTFNNFVNLTINYANPADIVFSTHISSPGLALANEVDMIDPMTSGTIGAAVPEPGAVPLMLFVVGFVAWATIKRTSWSLR